MSARNPHYSSPARARIIATSYPEDTLVACRDLKLSAKLHNPDLGSAPEFEVIATGDETRALRRWKRGRYFVGGEARYAECMTWIARNSELCAAAAKAQTEEAWAALDRHQGRDRPYSTYRAQRPRGGWGDSDYEKRDDNKEGCNKFRCYAWDEIVIATANGRGLRCERVSIPSRDFVIMWVWATKRDFRAAQYEWLQRMIEKLPKYVALDKPEPVEEINLFV